MTNLLKKAEADHILCEKLQSVTKHTGRVQTQMLKVIDLMHGVGCVGDILDEEQKKLRKMINDTCYEVIALNKEYHFLTKKYNLKDSVERFHVCEDAAVIINEMIQAAEYAV